MRISLDWLNDYVDIADLTVEQVSDALTGSGLEVELEEKIAPFTDQVVVGEVLQAQKHPNADSLNLCQVNTGQGDPLAIVCGAPNVRTGLKVALIPVGAALPDGTKIKASKIRGEKSQGMICSERELDISDDHEQIIELAHDAPVGKSVAEFLKLQDTVLTLNITPNRADCLGYLGVARDLAAKLNRPLKQPATEHQSTGELQTKDRVSLKVGEESGCPRFVALAIAGLKTIGSPGWMKRRLNAAGMRPINLIVDTTNYAMLEWGQPIHAYDERHIRGKTIQVRTAKDGETLQTLDEETRKLDPGDILICDQDGPIGLAGIMGGLNSEVKEDTESIILEVAHFDAITIHRTSKRLAMHTEASHRFERGVDLDAPSRVADRVAHLLQRCCQEQKQPLPQVAASRLDHFPNQPSLAKIALRLDRAVQMLSLPQRMKDPIPDHLQRLGCKQLDRNGDRVLFEIPSWRADIIREIDLIEEAGRLIGYDKIPYSMPQMNIQPSPEHDLIDFTDQSKVILAQLGMTEVVSFPFIAEEEFSQFRWGAEHPYRCAVKLQNPLAEDQAMLRTSLLLPLLRAVKENRNRGEKSVRLFESGRGFFDFKTTPCPDAWGDRLATKELHLTHRAKEDDRPVERTWLSGVLTDPLQDKHWNHPEQAPTFFDGKALVEQLGKSFSIRWSWQKIAADDYPFLNPNAAAVCVGPQGPIGFVGELHPETALHYGLGIDECTIVFELDGEKLFTASQQPKKFQTSVSKFPPASRDLSLVVDHDVQHQNVLERIQGFKVRNLKRYHLFDVYQGDKLDAGKKSMTYRFYFQSDQRTLNDKEVDSEVQALLQWLGDGLGASIR